MGHTHVGYVERPAMQLKPLDPDVIAAQLKNEETTKLQKITPVIQAKWPGADSIIMEFYLTDGRITVDEYNVAHRGKPKKVDYLLLHYQNIPLALVEAKGSDHSADEGYSQAVEYAKLLDVPFAYATNGDDLIERDMISGLNKSMKLDDFPGPDELWDRFLKESKIAPESESIYTYPYYVTPTGKRPRYYQRIIINRVTKAVMEGRKRILVVCATGTGKTFEAFQIIWRLWKSGVKKKILFLADRNILVDQTIQNDFAPFEQAMVKFDNDRIDTAHEIYLALYQQLKNNTGDHYKRYPRDFFDLIVVDECHRSSANYDSTWHEILDYFDEATKIGLTATPKDDKDPGRSNFAYFGNPIYTYSLKQGIEDGFLAPYKVIVPELNIDKKGYLPPENAVDVDGNPIERRIYTQAEFDRAIIVAERRETVAKRITDFMKANDMRYAKTIVFCEDIPHCQEMVRLLENENADLVAEADAAGGSYVMQITGDNPVGKAQLDNFIAPRSKYPVIAVTSRLMSTGVDAQTCEIIVLDRVIGSMTEFKQIIGRGTRIKEKYKVDGVEKSKMYFTILDFRSNYKKFNDPEFDGEPVDITNVPEEGDFPKPPVKPGKGTNPPVPPKNRRVARVDGVFVEIIDEQVQYLDENGNLVKQNLTSCTRNNILSHYATFEDFKQAWLLTKNKTTLAKQLLLELEWAENFEIRYGYKVDDFDIIANFAYDIDPPMSRGRRTRSASVERFIGQFEEEDVQELVRLMLNAYVVSGFECLRDINVFNLLHFKDKGWTKLKAVKKLGGKESYYALLNNLENALYE